MATRRLLPEYPTDGLFRFDAPVARVSNVSMHRLHMERALTIPGIPSNLSIRRSVVCLLEEMRRERADRVMYELGLALIGDESMRRVNREQRGTDSTTDVLSFPLLAFDDTAANPAAFPVHDGCLPIGDILVSVDACARQALEVGHAVADEFYRLCVHGILHLFGYDHELEEPAAVRMRAREDELLALLDATQPDGSVGATP